MQPIAIKWDTLINIPGSSFDFAPVWNFIPDTVNEPEQVFEKDGLRVKLSVTNGKVNATAEKDADTLRASGSVDTAVASTHVREITTITQTIELSWWGKVWQSVKGAIWFIVATLVILAIFIIRHAVSKRPY